LKEKTTESLKATDRNFEGEDDRIIEGKGDRILEGLENRNMKDKDD
jgi:hypothetical protein